MAERYENKPATSEQAVCQTCGAVIEDMTLHGAWHRSLRLATGQPVPAREVLASEASKPGI